ncbi:hypothetical protein [Pseudomonas guariconensis]|uniref:hypothetical protein n=1 Tax=Pseudomonas guariconensis TaxID=1288410 RepID=UPI003905B84E
MAAEDQIDNYGFLQFVNTNFTDLVSHYINMWAAFHQGFTAAAINICLWGGLAWVAVLTLKAPADKLKTAIGALSIVLLTGLLLQKGTYAVGPAGTQVGLASGAGWSVRIVGNVYQLFKSSIGAIAANDAMDLAIGNAFHVTNEETLAKFNKSPVRPLYEDYIKKCEPALTSLAGNSEDTRRLGQAIGLFGSAGINQAEVAKISKENYEKLMAGDKTAAMSLNRIVFGGSNPYGGYITAKQAKLLDEATKGQQLLAKIPLDANPFDGKSEGYRIPTTNYWQDQMFQKGQPGAPEYENVTDGENTMYIYSGYTQGTAVPQHQSSIFYPKNCLQMYMLVTKAVDNWTGAIKETVSVANRPAWMRDQLSTQTQMIRRINDKLEQERLMDKNGNVPTFSALHYKDQEVNWGFGDTANEIVNTFQALGAKWKEWFLKFYIPASINGCAMVAGLLVVLFPLICVFAVFISPAMLITYVKILVFLFTVPLLNSLVLTMSATLLALNEEVLNGLNAGDYTENFTVLISASTANYLIFMGLGVISLIIAKMLIWDDVKSLSAFNPGGAAAGAAMTGAAIVGTAVKVAGMLVSRGRMSPGSGGPSTPAAGGMQPPPFQSSVTGNPNTPRLPSSSSYTAAGNRLSGPRPPSGGNLPPGRNGGFPALPPPKTPPRGGPPKNS